MDSAFASAEFMLAARWHAEGQWKASGVEVVEVVVEGAQAGTGAGQVDAWSSAVGRWVRRSTVVGCLRYGEAGKQGDSGDGGDGQTGRHAAPRSAAGSEECSGAEGGVGCAAGGLWRC